MGIIFSIPLILHVLFSKDILKGIQQINATNRHVIVKHTNNAIAMDF